MHFPTIIKYGSNMETNPTISQGRELQSGMGSQQALSVLTVTHPLRLPFAQKQDLPQRLEHNNIFGASYQFMDVCLLE
jgi:hypothetical protein